MEKLKLKVIKDMFYVSEDLSYIGGVDKETFENSFTHMLVVGDIWEEMVGEGNFSDKVFECTSGEWKDEENDGIWDYEFYKDYFEMIS
jgi:hypothetical protein